MRVPARCDPFSVWCSMPKCGNTIMQQPAPLHVCGVTPAPHPPALVGHYGWPIGIGGGGGTMASLRGRRMMS